MKISTKHLIIRNFVPEDAEAFYELTKDEGFNLFPITIYRQTSIETALEWIKQNVGKVAVWDKSTGKLIGIGGLTPWKWDDEDLVDITYRFRESAWGKGYGTETAAALVRYGQETLKLKNITATITPDNTGSKKIAEKLGFKFYKNIVLKGVPTVMYRL